MVESMRWFTPASAGMLAFALFGIEEIGIEIEDPFGYDPNDLPLDQVGETIGRDVLDIDGADRGAARSLSKSA
jgi:putative membrane protein